MSKLDVTKPVQTRDGRKVRILCTDRDDLYYPIVALIGANAVLNIYTKDGKYDWMKREEHGRDLINVPNEITVDDEVMMSKLDLTKPVQTRDGRKVRILSTDRISEKYPILALIGEEEEKLYSYTAEGRFYENRDARHDLVNVPDDAEVNK
jgi:hypothetical protein